MLIAVLAPLGCAASETPEPPTTRAKAAVAETSIPQTSSTSKPHAAEEPAVAVRGISSKIKFKGADGEVSFSVKPEGDGAKLVDSTEQEIARFTVDGNKLKVKDAADVVLGFVVVVDGHFKIKNAKQTVELFKLQSQADGDWKLENGGGDLIYKIKKRDYGFEIEDGNDNSVSKAKRKSGKTSLRNSAEETVLYTKDDISTLAFACMGLDSVKSQPLQAGLMTMVILHSR
ncbi:MAG: hypothetical protein ABJZ55_04670 [Fuerstiella sp.]